MCSELTYQVIFVQEHWLTPDQLYKLCTISPEYTCVGISAMEDVLANDMLRGRPFGGVSILVRDMYNQHITVHKCSERFVVLSIGSVLFVNVYLPGYRGQTEVLLITQIVEEITTIISDIKYEYLIVGGDINFDPKSPTPASIPFNNFCKDHNIELCTLHFDAINDLVTHTYEQTTLGHFSRIDHFFISKFHDDIIACGTSPIIDYRNFSNHIPIVLSLCIPDSCLAKEKTSNFVNDLQDKELEVNNKIHFNWKKANLNLYYETTRLAFEPLWLSIQNTALQTENTDEALIDAHSEINALYTKIIDTLKKVSLECIPIFRNGKKNVAKFWWDEEMNI